MNFRPGEATCILRSHNSTQQTASNVLGANTSWRAVLADRVMQFGHRNYICIVDSAYPAQTGSGVETIVTGADQIEVVRAVLGALAKAPHVRPVVILDQELAVLTEQDAKGIDRYRTEMERAIRGLPVERVLHE